MSDALSLLSSGKPRERTAHTHIWVTALYLGSFGEIVRKSALTASTFSHFARESIVCRVAYRFRSRSKAKSCQPNHTQNILHQSTCNLPKLNGPRYRGDRRKTVRTLPLFCISAARWEVLFPGAAVASIATVPFSAGGASINAGKHDALSCNIIFPSR